MAKPLYTPRVNNNDDTVSVIELHVTAGDHINPGDIVAEIETTKSTVDVEAEHGGFVLDVLCREQEEIPVGSVMMWIGESADEPIPELPSVQQAAPAAASVGRPTAKALGLLRKFDLRADEVPASGERLSVADVEAYASKKGLTAGPPRATTVAVDRIPDVPGDTLDLSTEERGMLDTVSWHRDQAAAAYLEIEYDPTIWDEAAAAYATEHGLMLSPLLPLMAYRLVELARENPKLNSTIVGNQRYQYGPINLGFTVQADNTLYLAVVNDAGSMEVGPFISALGEVQRHAMGHKLKPEESQGATLSFSSMSRWRVTRHMPILPPNTSVMVAHTATSSHGRAVLGASYDHRVLSGFDVARLLRGLATPQV